MAKKYRKKKPAAGGGRTAIRWNQKTNGAIEADLEREVADARRFCMSP